MSRRTPGTGALLAVVAGLATWISLWAWRGFVIDASSYLLPAAGGIAAIAVAGVLARAARMPAFVVVAGQLLVVMVFGNLAWGSSSLPTAESLRTAVLAVRSAVEASQAYAAPVPPDAPSLVPLLVLGALLLHVLVDLFAVTLGRVPVAGLPLLTIYSLPVSVLQDGVSWLVFVLVATCFLAMLTLQERTRVTRWGRPVDAPGSFSTHQAGGAGLAAAAIATALVVPLVVPTLDLGLLDRLGTGAGSGNDGEVRIDNPMTDMKRDLVLGPDLPLLHVAGETGEEPAPSYLRLAVLTTYTGSAWTPGDRDLPEANAATGEVPWPTGLDEEVPHQERRLRFGATDALDSKWLPVPRFSSAVDAGEEWRYDSRVLDFHARDDDVNTAGQSWTAVSLDLDLDARALDAAGPGSPVIHRTYTAVPPDLPPAVVELAERVTEGAGSDYERAAMLQRFFQEEFRYDISQQPGNGTDDLMRFLFEDRRGYCEQFASAMGVMLRAVDVPARVSVGLLRPDRVDGDEGTFEFSSRDMHAWPEVYLDGYGWVMFEPTPTTHTESLPDYSQGVRPRDEPTSPETSRSPSASASPTTRPQVSPSVSPAPAPEDADSGRGEGSGFPWVTVLWMLAVALLLVGLALLPHLLRSRRSERRWHGDLPAAEAAWAELRDRVVDLGLPWPEGRSPRRTAGMVSAHLAAPRTPDTPQRPQKGPDVAPEAAEALHVLAGALEETRYAPPGAATHDVEELRARVETVGASLEAGTTPGRRRVAHWLPRSLVRRDRADQGQDELVDSLS